MTTKPLLAALVLSLLPNFHKILRRQPCPFQGRTFKSDKYLDCGDLSKGFAGRLARIFHHPDVHRDRGHRGSVNTRVYGDLFEFPN